MGFKIYSTTFLNIADGESQEKVIQVNKNIKFYALSITNFSDTAYIGVRIEDLELFNPDFLATNHFRQNAGNLYSLPDLDVEAKKTITMKFKNNTGSTISSFTIALHGIEE